MQPLSVECGVAEVRQLAAINLSESFKAWSTSAIWYWEWKLAILSDSGFGFSRFAFRINHFCRKCCTKHHSTLNHSNFNCTSIHYLIGISCTGGVSIFWLSTRNNNGQNCSKKQPYENRGYLKPCIISRWYHTKSKSPGRLHSCGCTFSEIFSIRFLITPVLVGNEQTNKTDLRRKSRTIAGAQKMSIHIYPKERNSRLK